jgi:hypothetical protein
MKSTPKHDRSQPATTPDARPADQTPQGQAPGSPASTNGQPPPAPPPTINPFDPAGYRVSQSLAAAAGVKKVLTDLSVCTPKAEWFVRRHPSPEYAMDGWVIDLKDAGEQYLVRWDIVPSLLGEATLKAKSFYLAVTMQGKAFLWAVRREPDEEKQPAKWMRAPLEAVRLAKDHWTRIAWNEATRQHDVSTSNSSVEPVWPDLTFEQVLKLAFRDYMIEGLDHPILRQLRGESR